jgi:putative protease
LLFYTPRKLLSNQIKEHLQGLPDYQKEFVANGTSMESPHSGFEIIQNSGGTLMYAPNHFCLLDLVGNLEDIGVDSVRLDIRDLEDDVQINVLSNYLKSLNDQQMKEFKQVYPKRVLKGLFVVNKSKVLFKKLKNKRLEDVQNHHAMVVEVVKNSHMLIKQIGEQVIKVNDQILIQSPDGREKTVQLKWLKALDGNNCDQTIAGKHFIVSVVPAISIKSKITVLN